MGTTKLALIDPSWRAENPDTDCYFFLAQELQEPVAEGRLAMTANKLAPVAAACNQGRWPVIVDNGAYEGQMLKATDLMEGIEQFDQLEANQPIWVPPDFPGCAFRHTYESFVAFRSMLPKTKRPVPLMLIPHSRPGDMAGYIEACLDAVDARPDWIGISILAAPLASRDFNFARQRGAFTAGPEFCRSIVCSRIPQRFWDTCERHAIGIHLLGLGWDWWQLALNDRLKYCASIDTHKPVTYAERDTLMYPWFVIDRRFKADRPADVEVQAALKVNLMRVKNLLANPSQFRDDHGVAW